VNQPPVLDYEGSEYQREFWDEGGRAYEDRVEAVALSRLLPRSGGHLLEVGAGAGRNTPRYAGFSRVTLLDYSRSQLAQARSRLGDGARYVYVVADVYRMPFADGTFDAATMIRTLHHMAEPGRALGEIRNALGSGGRLILEYPNKRNAKSIARWWLRRQRWDPFDLKPVEFARLNFDFHPRAVRAWLQGARFEIERQLTVSHFRTGILKRILPLGLLVTMDSAAQWTGNMWQLTPSVFVRAKAIGSPTSASSGAWRCPECRATPMEEVPGGVRCRNCGRKWGLRDGIWDFREPQSA
jgi:SAM-dependent methyltransferase